MINSPNQPVSAHGVLPQDAPPVHQDGDIWTRALGLGDELTGARVGHFAVLLGNLGWLPEPIPFQTIDACKRLRA